ncbi:MAG: hypothetical protein GC154_08385 [bacterium]|nr:hypothetical protein [bacterium]
MTFFRLTKDEVRRHAPVILLIAGPILAFHWKIWLLGEWICGGDLINQFVPWRHFALDELARGRFPGWNPYVFCGAPFAANIQTSLFYPFNLLNLLFSVEWTFSLSLAAHHLAAGLAMYAFLYSLTRSRAGAALGAAAYAWSGFLITHAHDGHLIHVRAYAWIPLVLLAQGRGSDWTPRRLASFSLCLAMMFFAGHTQIPLYVFYLVLFRSAWLGFFRWRAERRVMSALQGPLWTAAGLAFSLALSAVVLIPLLQLSKHTAGRAGGADYAFATSDSLPPSFLPAYIAPLFYGDPTAKARESQYWLSRTGYHEICGYAGVLTLILAAMVFAPQNGRAESNRPYWSGREDWFFLLAGAGGLFFALGAYNPLYPILYYGLPGWSYFRVPGRLALIFIIGASVCASIGLKRWLDADRRALADSAALKLASAGSLLLPLAWVIVLSSKPALTQWLREMEVDRTVMELQLWTANRNAISDRLPESLFAARYSFMAFALGLASLWLALGWASLGAARRWRWARLLPAAALMVDLLFFSCRFIETRPADGWMKTFYPASPILEAARSAAGEGRVLELDDAIGYPGIDRFPELRPNRPMRYGLKTARGYDPLILTSYARYVNRIYGKPLDAPQGGLLFFPEVPPGDALSAMGINAVASSHNPGEGFEPAWDDGSASVNVYRVRHPFDLYRFASSGSAESISRTAGTPESISLECETPVDDIVIIKQTWYPGWRVRLDGDDLDTAAYDGVWLSARVPAGRHHVDFYFSHGIFWTGGVVSLCGFMVMLMFFLYNKPRIRE